MIDDQTLTLYHYRDGLDDTGREAVARALATDAVLAARYRALVADLERIQPGPLTAAPSHLKHQWHDRLAREAQLERQKVAPTQASPRPRWHLGAAFAAVLALGVAIGVWVPGQTPGPATDPGAVAIAPVANDQDVTPRLASFERGLQMHLRESRSELASLDPRDDAGRDALLAQIIAQNRLFERAAEKQQAPDIARVIRAIEPILLRLADTDTAPAEAETLQRQLAFELNAVLTRLQRPASKPTTI